MGSRRPLNSAADRGKLIPAAAALYKFKVVKFSACFVWRDLENLITAAMATTWNRLHLPTCLLSSFF